MAGEPDPQTLWRSQATEHAPMTLAQIHDKAKAFQARIRRRNVVEYVACVVVIAGFTPVLLIRDSWMMQVGALLIMTATAFVASQLHQRGSAQRVPDGGAALIASYRQELIRQRDALRSVGVWYLAPFLPGLGLLMLGRWFQWHASGRSLGLDHLIIALSEGIVVLVFVVLWLVNQRAANRIQKRIDEL
jgi:hypothetical protein